MTINYKPSAFTSDTIARKVTDKINTVSGISATLISPDLPFARIISIEISNDATSEDLFYLGVLVGSQEGLGFHNTNP
jgi:hypothetical protein